MCSVGVNTEKLTTEYTDGILSGALTTPTLSSGAPTFADGVFSGVPTTLSPVVLSVLDVSHTDNSVVGAPLKTPSVQVGAPLDSVGVVGAPLDSVGVVGAPLKTPSAKVDGQ
ncbi:unnamed protein product [Rotaria socialis]|uniref:Uncharacterized protein n=1 Tax=Rotaria socialis TaxID=392032 RepID=A0A817XL26_9BILA|nr:unnamed protein product [Rotaria socialis]CAF4453734.1 unnamed protein product [Rotaria socialis]